METFRKVFAFSGFAVLSAKLLYSCKNSTYRQFYFEDEVLYHIDDKVLYHIDDKVLHHIEDDVMFCKAMYN